jgi:predicted amidohydrolase YtcJ
MRAARDRRTAAGALLGPTERLTPEEALNLYLAPLEAPEGPPKRLVAGSVADLVLMRAPWSTCRAELDAGLVRATVARGCLVYLASGPGTA